MRRVAPPKNVGMKSRGLYRGRRRREARIVCRFVNPAAIPGAPVCIELRMAARNPQPDPEIIPPRRSRAGADIDDQSLAALARLLDDIFCIPGTQIRFGLDPLIGLIPGLGDVITGLFSFVIIFAGWQRRLPRVTIARMVANVALDTLFGAIPLVGDVFDVAWKSNRMNLALLQREQSARSTRNVVVDGLFLAAIALAALVLIAAPFALIWLLVAHR